MTLAMILIDRIRVGPRLRVTNPEQVAKLEESIAEVGLINPITVRPKQVIEGGNAVDGYGVVAGVHRLEACKRLGWIEIPAQVLEMPELRLWLAEIDENLAGPTLTKAERALFTRRRKEIYEQLHPDTTAGGDRRSENFKTTNCRSEAFTEDTAQKTGVDRRTVEREAKRGENILEEVLEAIPGTSLDSGAELDALLKLTPEQQRELAEKVKAGQDVSARPGVKPRKPRGSGRARGKGGGPARRTLSQAEKDMRAAVGEQADRAAESLIDLIIRFVPAEHWPVVESSLEGTTLPRLARIFNQRMLERKDAA
jgi:ParB family transcriptional regulator, chromosome partitioning protein